jgi:pimeloyl-ACP methyl ester carboxylesterase
VKVPFIPYQFKKILVADAITHSEFDKKIWRDMRWDHTKETPSLLETSLERYLARIQAPVLILWGDADKILDVGGVSALENNLKNYRTVIMKATGHIPMLEKPRETASHYVSFLKGKS